MTELEIKKQMGKRLKDIRLIRRLSQEQVGAICGVTFQQVQKYEKGRNGISSYRLLQLCHGLNVSESYFLKGLIPELQNFVGSTNVQQNQECTLAEKTLENDM